jgi:hypothetical protein
MIRFENDKGHCRNNRGINHELRLNDFENKSSENALSFMQVKLKWYVNM